MSDLTLAKAGLATICATSTLTAASLAKWQLSNIYKGDKDGKGPYDSLSKRVGQAALSVICTTATIIAVESFVQLMKDQEIELAAITEDVKNERFARIATSLISQNLPTLASVKNVKLAATTAIATLGATSSISNIITGDKAFGKPYGNFSKRLLSATMVAVTTAALISLYRMEPEICQTAISIGFSGVKVVASTVLSATATATSCIGAVVGGAWSIAKYARSFF